MLANSMGQENCEPRACVKRTLSMREERGCNLSCLYCVAACAASASRGMPYPIVFVFPIGFCQIPRRCIMRRYMGCLPAYLYRRAAQALSCVICRTRWLTPTDCTLHCSNGRGS